MLDAICLRHTIIIPVSTIFFKLTLICTPVAWDAPTNKSRTFCSDLIVSSVDEVGSGYTWMMLESSAKQYPTILRVSLESHNLKTDPNTAPRRQLSSGVLTMDQIYGAAQLYCPSP